MDSSPVAGTGLVGVRRIVGGRAAGIGLHQVEGHNLKYTRIHPLVTLMLGGIKSKLP